MKRYAFLLGLLAALPLSTQARAESWKMHAVWNDARPETQLSQQWAKAVGAKTGGKLTIKVFPGGQLGLKDVDMLRILPPGNVIQTASLWPGYMSRDEPAYANLLPLGAVPSVEKYVALMPALAEMYDSTYKKYGIKFLGMFPPPARSSAIFCKEPVSDLKTLRAKKLRVWDKTLIETFGELGVAAQIIPQNDLYVALQTGVVDCAIYASAYALSVSLQEVAPYASYITPFIVHPITMIVSGKSWSGLSPDVQKVLQDEAGKISKTALEMLTTGSWEKEHTTDFAKKGVKVLAPFPDADQTALTNAAHVVWRRLMTAAGPKAAEWQKQLESKLQ